MIVRGTVSKVQIFKSFLKSFLPKILINTGSKLIQCNDVSANRLAFRSFIICRMNKIFEEDSKIFKQSDH